MLISTSNEISSSSLPLMSSPRPAWHSTTRKKKRRVCCRQLCPKRRRIRSREIVDTLLLSCRGSRGRCKFGHRRLSDSCLLVSIRGKKKGQKVRKINIDLICEQ